MSVSKHLNSAKRLKAVTGYSESEILAVLSDLEDSKQFAVNELITVLYTKLQKVDTRKFEKPPSKKKQPTSTEEQKITAIIAKIKQVLQQYGASERLDRWDLSNISQAFNTKYEDCDEDAIIRLHKQLISVEKSVCKTKLLTFVERGRMYNFLKVSERWCNKWLELCSRLEMCSRTANRYINFFNIITAFPRLLICDLSFETIMSNYKKLRDYLTVEHELADQLAMPLKTTLVKSQTQMFTFNR